MKVLILLLISSFFAGLGSSAVAKERKRGMTFNERLERLRDAKEQQRVDNRKSASQISEEVVGLLKEKGAQGVRELKTQVKGLDLKAVAKEQGVDAPDDFERLESSMAKNGGVQVVTPMPERYQKKINGNLVQESYRLEYKDGTMQVINLKYIKPTITGGMELMEVTVE